MKLRWLVTELSVGVVVVTKKPWPEIARSVGELVASVSPCWLTSWRVVLVTPPAV